ncbi:MAG TPA: tetratricopeptide repeat protein [Syntrophales bacterium]|nr:tetratricopeptide repeat protein [Syntrophales bacterium]
MNAFSADEKRRTSGDPSAPLQKNALAYLPLLSLAVVLAYSNTFSAPFIFDDQVNIVENDSIHCLSPLSQVLAPPFGIGIAGRPVVNLSLALNYAVSGLDPWSYHLLNLFVHLAAALCLFGILRRTFLSGALKGRYGNAAAPLAFACSLLWALHPLQTQAVTYVIQRCESLMGLCFLLTFYLAIRGWQSPAPQRWHLAAVLSFLLGIGTKEVIAAAPVLLFFYNWIFFPGGIGTILRRSAPLYGGLAVGLLGLGLLVAGGGTLSSGTRLITFAATDYWRTQPEIILHYLGLVFLPWGLSIDYGWPVAETWDWTLLLHGTAVVGILAASLLALMRRKPIGFAGVCFFVLLAPTSLMPLPDAAFEHRMYLPSIAVVVLAVTGLYGLWNAAAARRARDGAERSIAMVRGFPCLVMVAGILLGAATYARNADYRSDVSIWADAVRKHPGNSRAHANLANAFMHDGNLRSAVEHLYTALEIEAGNARRYGDGKKYYEYLGRRPVYGKVQDNLGWAWLQKGNAAEAEKHFREALKVDHRNAIVLSHMGIALHLQGRHGEAREHFRAALSIRPHDPDVNINTGAALRLQGRPGEAIGHFQAALSVVPQNVEAHYGMGMALRQLGREPEAAAHFREVMRLNPRFAPVGNAAGSLSKQ